MPTVPKGSLVLISGPSGYLGARTSPLSHPRAPPTSPLPHLLLARYDDGPHVRFASHADCAFQLLKHGFRVRGTVRSKEKGEYLKQLFQGEGEFDYVIVEDVEAVSLVLFPVLTFLRDSHFADLGSRARSTRRSRASMRSCTPYVPLSPARSPRTIKHTTTHPPVRAGLPVPLQRAGPVQGPDQPGRRGDAERAQVGQEGTERQARRHHRQFRVHRRAEGPGDVCLYGEGLERVQPEAGECSPPVGGSLIWGQ